MKEKLVIKYSARRTFLTIFSASLCFISLVSIIIFKSKACFLLPFILFLIMLAVLVPLAYYSIYLITYRLEYENGDICCRTLMGMKCINISDVKDVVGLSRLKKRDVILRTNENVAIPMPKFNEKSIVIIGDIYNIKKF